MMQLQDRVLAQVVEDKITGAGEQLRLWSKEDQERWDREAGRYRLEHTYFSAYPLEYIRMEFPVSNVPEEQLALPLDK